MNENLFFFRNNRKSHGKFINSMVLLVVAAGMSTVGQAQTIPVMQVFEIQTDYNLENAPIQFDDPSGNMIPTEMVSLSLQSVAPVGITQLRADDFQIDSSFDITYELNNRSTTTHTASGRFVRNFTRNPGLDNGPNEQNWDCELVSMSLQGQAGPVLLMVDLFPLPPTNLKITDLGGNNFQVDSFFDVFFDISLDGGQTTNLASTPSRMGSHGVVNLVPEPGSFVIIGCAFGFIGMSRRRRI